MTRMLRTVAAFAAAVAVGGCAGATQVAPVRPTAAKLYVVNQAGATITVIDQARLAVDTVLDLRTMGFTSNAKPHHVVVEPDGGFWYASLIGDGRVVKFDRENRVVGQVRLETPGLLAIDPLHDSLYVGRSMTAVNPPKSLGVIRRSTFTLVDEQEILVTRPHALLVTRDGKWVHTASLAENRIASVEVATGRVTLTTIPGAPRSLVQFAQSRDGRLMAVGGELSNSVLVFDLSQPPPFTPVREIAVPGKPWDPMFAADNATVYISLFAGDGVAAVDARRGTVVKTYSGNMAQPYGLIVSADGRHLFVVNQNAGAVKPGASAHDNMPGMAGGKDMKLTDGWLSVISLATGQTVKTLMLGTGPTGAGAAGAR